MEAAYNDFVKEESVMSNCWVLLDPKSKNKVTNIEIVIWINELHRSLDNDHEVGIKINHLGKQVVFYIDHIAHQNQAMIYFKGHTESGKLVHFVKPTSELSIELQSLQRRSTDTTKLPFGFDSWDDFDNAKGLDA